MDINTTIPKTGEDGWSYCPGCARTIKKYIDSGKHKIKFCPFCGCRIHWNPTIHDMTIADFNKIVDMHCNTSECGSCKFWVDNNCAIKALEIIEEAMRNGGYVDEDWEFTDAGIKIVEESQ